MITNFVEELKKELQDNSFPTHENHSAVWLDTVETILNDLHNKYENNGDDWIPVKTSLPTTTGMFQTTTQNMETGALDVCHEIFWTSDNKWDCERDDLSEWKVIAWKEKDKPYTPKGE